MDNTINFKLINGDFFPQEAKEVLLKLIHSKISHNQLEAFSISERNSGNIEHLKRRTTELNEAKELIESFLLIAEKENKKLKIEGSITIDFID